MSTIDEIKARLDIVEYIGQYAALKRAGRTYKVCCPFHQERTPSFVVDPDKQTWRCYGACATGGDVIKFAMQRHGWTFLEALRELGERVGVAVRPASDADRQRADVGERLRGLLGSAAAFYHDQLRAAATPQAAAALKYARAKRGLSDATIDAFQLGYAPDGWSTLADALRHMGASEDDLLAAGLCGRSDKSGKLYDRFRHRLIVPIRDGRGRVVGFGGRALDPDEPAKYLNSPQTDVFDKSSLLFGLDRAADSIRESGVVVVVEGYMDALQAHQAGYANVVAQMGTALTEAQVRLVAPRLATRLVLALDSDPAGQRATRRSLDVVRHTLAADFTGRLQVDVRVLVVPGAKDPDDFIRDDPDAWDALVGQAQPVADWLIATQVAGLPPGASPVEREALARELLPTLVATESDLQRGVSIQALAHALHLPETVLLHEAASLRTRLRRAHDRPATHASTPPSANTPPLPLAFHDEPPPAPARTVPPSPLAQHVLHLLFADPPLLYHVNRALQQLALGSPRYTPLLAGPLAPLSVDDFPHPAHKALLDTLQDALHNDAHDVAAFVEGRLDQSLQETLQNIKVGTLSVQLAGVRMVGVQDIDIERHDRLLLAHTHEAMRHDVIQTGLRLRAERVRHVCTDLSHALREARHDGDAVHAHALGQQHWLWSHARQLVDKALRRPL